MGDPAASAGLQLHACAGDEPTAWWPAGTLYPTDDGHSRSVSAGSIDPLLATIVRQPV